MVELIQKQSPKHWPSTGPPVELLVDHLLLLIVAKIQVGWAAHGTKALCKLLKVRIGTASIVVLNWWWIFCVETGPKIWKKSDGLKLGQFTFWVGDSSSFQQQAAKEERQLALNVPQTFAPKIHQNPVPLAHFTIFRWTLSVNIFFSSKICLKIIWIAIFDGRVSTDTHLAKTCLRRFLFAWVENYQRDFAKTYIFNEYFGHRFRGMSLRISRCLEMGQSWNKLLLRYTIHGFTS